MLEIWGNHTSAEIEAMDRQDTIVAMVAGSCEQHARHLPLNTDTILGEAVTKAAAEKSEKKVLLLPTIPYGFSKHHLKFTGSVSIEQEEMASVVATVFKTVHSYGFKNLLVVNSHGGNSVSLQYALNELGSKYGVKLIFAKYWDFAADYIQNKWRDSPVGGLGHAGEMETALMMYLAPELVRMGEIKDYKLPEGGNNWFNADMFAKNSIVMYNDFNLYSPDGNVGLAQYATPEKGRELFEYCSSRMAELFNGFWVDNQYV